MKEKLNELIIKLNKEIDLNFVCERDSYNVLYSAKKKGVGLSLLFQFQGNSKVKAILSIGDYAKDGRNYQSKSISFSIEKQINNIIKNDLIKRLCLLDVDNVIDAILASRKQKEENERNRQYELAVLNRYFNFNQSWHNKHYAKEKNLDIAVSEHLDEISIRADPDTIIKVCAFLRNEINSR